MSGGQTADESVEPVFVHMEASQLCSLQPRYMRFCIYCISGFWVSDYNVCMSFVPQGHRDKQGFKKM